MSIFPIILNSKNVDPSDFSKYTYKFPRGSIQLRNASICLSQLQIFFSWRNIDDKLYNNSRFNLIFPELDGVVNFSVKIPDGNYSVEDLNNYLQLFMIRQNKYLVNTTTNQNLYFYEIISNRNTYKVSLISYPVPTSLSQMPGYREGGGIGSFKFPTTSTSPILQILDNNNFGDLIGFTPGLYSNSSESSKTPEMSPVSSLLVTCSLINNKFTSPSNVLYSFVSGGTEYGRMMSISNQDLQYSKIDDGYYNEVVIKFIAQDFTRVNILDPNLIIYLIVKIDE